jgi:hypothetical protein
VLGPMEVLVEDGIIAEVSSSTQVKDFRTDRTAD